MKRVEAKETRREGNERGRQERVHGLNGRAIREREARGGSYELEKLGVGGQGEKS